MRSQYSAQTTRLACAASLLLVACQHPKAPQVDVDILKSAPPSAGAGACPTLATDWLALLPTQQRRIEPAHCSQQVGTPLFAWGDPRNQQTGSSYILHVRQLGGSAVLSRTGLTEPRARLGQALSPGDYEWSVSYTASNGGAQTSQWRSFSVGAADGQLRAQDLLDGTLLAAQVAARARPRMLAAGSSFESLRSAAQQPEHLPALTLLRKRANAALTAALPAAPAAAGPAAPVTTLAQAQAITNGVLSARNERQHIENLGLIGKLDNDGSLIAAAKRRLLSLAGWSPSAGTANAGEANVEVALALAQGLDLLWNELSAAERSQITAPLRERLLQGSAALAQLDREPYMVTSLLRLRQITQALLLCAGLPGFPEAQSLLSNAWELNRHSFHTWGQDGNQGPAITQAWTYFASTTGMAAAVRTVAGVNLYDLAVLRRSAEQLIAFTPAGHSLPGAFGDDGETRNLYDNHAAALRLHAQQSRDIAAIWYWQAKGGNVSNPSDASIWQLLLLGANRSAMPVGSASLSNDWFSGQAGLAALHNDIRRADRTSVYFRSSRFGAHGAAQAEQNAIVYVSRGQPLLVNAGVTPFPGSPHHRNTRATRFKNALSFDGGFGQAESATGAARPTDPLSNMDAGGSLIRAQSVGNYAAVTGDATLAYRAVDATRNTWVPQLSNAIRSVVMDKANGLTFVYDWATSATPRQWELNYHAPNAFIADAATVRSSNGAASVCLDRHGPATQFTQTNTWEVPPEVTQAAPSRGRFTTLLRSAEFAHLTVLREDCRTVPLQVTQNGAKISVLVNGRDALQFDRSGISLPAAGGAAPTVTVAAAPSSGTAGHLAASDGATSTSSVLGLSAGSTPPSAAAAVAGTVAGATANAPASCSLNSVRGFGNACFAATKAELGAGASRSFPNLKPGLRGSTTATCVDGKVAWSAETCAAIPSLSGTVARTMNMQAATATESSYLIGSYYFGGWKDNQVGSGYAKPWEPLALYPDREPRLGKYAEDTPGVMTQQLKWMRQYGIDFTVFNWFWARHDAPVMDHALRAYLALSNREGVKFAVQWSNHTDYNFSRAQFETLFRFWARNYFKHADYQRFNGKPVVFIFSAPVLLRNAKAIGLSSADLIKLADDMARAEGLPGVSVVGGMWGGDASFDYAGAGYAAYTMYNYHSPANIALQPSRPGNVSRSFAELHQSYANQWNWMLQRTTLPFIVPMSSGWDKRPWGGSTDPLHDDSRSTPAEFLVHLQAARALMDANPQRTQRMGLVCCWNELGEGSFIEPTKTDGFSYIEQIPKVFGAR